MVVHILEFRMWLLVENNIKKLDFSNCKEYEIYKTHSSSEVVTFENNKLFGMESNKVSKT